MDQSFFFAKSGRRKKIECAQFIQIHCISFEHSAGRRTRRLISDTAFVAYKLYSWWLHVTILIY